MAKRKAPATTPALDNCSAMEVEYPWGSSVSACRNKRTLPFAWAAPAFIWRARPGCEIITEAPASRARSTVRSLLPPSTTRISWGASVAAAATEAPQEILVVDGGSSDRTVDRAREAGASVMISQPGRARQMNAGAAQAKGNVLLFLH